MKFLILHNGAPNYHKFFNQLSERLIRDGHSVELAVDCAFHRDVNEIDTLGLPVHEFSDFWATFDEDTTEILEEYSEFPLNSALHSDFERAEVYGIGATRNNSYYSSLQVALLCFFDRIFRNSDIDVVLYENISNTFAHFAWYVCKKFDIDYVGLTSSRLPGRFAIVNGPFSEGNKYKRILDEILEGRKEIPKEVSQWVSAYLENLDHIEPDYMRYNKLDQTNILTKYVKLSKLRRLLIAWKHRNDRHHLAFQVGHPIKYMWSMFYRSIKRKLREKNCRKYFSKPIASEKYLLYPLHFHPESSTSIYARPFINEYEVIRNIAFSLPINTMLYVKDHSSAFANPNLQFYRRLQSLPNVRLIEPEANAKKLIRDGLGVITLTSTMGYEALLLNKRVFLLGSVFYEFHPNIIKLDNYLDLFQSFKQGIISDNKVGSDYNELFVSAYYLGTFDGTLNFSFDDVKMTDLVEKIYSNLFEAIKVNQIDSGIKE